MASLRASGAASVHNKMNAPQEDAFEAGAERYDSWYDRHPFAYESEINAIRALLPKGERGLEVGTGTGRFAAELGIRVGLEPSRAMGDLARKRGVEVHIGRAERMPFADGSFDVVLMVMTLCFLGDVPAALKEVDRVLRPGGYIVIGMLDFSSPPGKRYREHGAGSDFFRDAVLLSVDEALVQLRQAGFVSWDVRQTIFEEPASMIRPDPVRDGNGLGLFVAIRAMKHVSMARGTWHRNTFDGNRRGT
jgi:ubiquinone/menaquinone biosynthesis C-methylase UbiE